MRVFYKQDYIIRSSEISFVGYAHPIGYSNFILYTTSYMLPNRAPSCWKYKSTKSTKDAEANLEANKAILDDMIDGKGEMRKNRLLTKLSSMGVISVSKTDRYARPRARSRAAPAGIRLVHDALERGDGWLARHGVRSTYAAPQTLD